jgi:hypothetical protein
VPKLTNVQRARFEARLEEIQQALPKRMRQRMSQGEDGSGRRRAS